MRYFFLLLLMIVFHCANAQERKAIDSSVTVWKTINRASYRVTYPNSWRVDTSKIAGADLFLFAQRDSDTDQFMENVNVMIQDLKGSMMTLDDYMKINESQIRKLANGIEFLVNERSIQNGIPFHKYIFTFKQGALDIKTEQYYYLQGEVAYCITLSTESSQFEKYKRIGESILNSFALKK